MKVSPEIEKIINKLNESKGNIPIDNFENINNIQIINQELNKIINNINQDFDFKSYKSEKINSVEKVINIYNICLLQIYYLVFYSIKISSIKRRNLFNRIIRKRFQ